MTDEVQVEQALALRLQIACIASCSCETKTHEARFHDPNCLYRVLQDAVARIEKLEADCDKYIWQVRDTCTRAEKAEALTATLQRQDERVRELEAENALLETREIDLMAEAVGTDHDIMMLKAALQDALALAEQHKDYINDLSENIDLRRHSVLQRQDAEFTSKTIAMIRATLKDTTHE